MIYNFLEKNKNLNQYAVICGNKKLSYKELYKRSLLLGEKILLDSSDIVIMFMPNSIYYVVSYFATLYAGKIVYPISHLSKPFELMSSIEKTGSNLILCTHEYYEVAKQSCGEKEINIILVDEEELYDSLLHHEISGKKVKTRNKDDVCVLLNTSGSTDKHKIVMLTENGIKINCRDWVNIALNPKEHANVLVALSLCSCVGTIVMNTCIMLGWTIVYLPTFLNSASILKTIKDKNITHLISIGSMLNILASDVEEIDTDEYDSVKFIGVGGNASPKSMKILMKFFKNAGVSPGYGMTEATCMVSTIPPEISRENEELFFRKIASSGKIFENCNVKILNSSNSENSPGEILISGPTIMKGYYNNKSATESVIEDGYLHTGDVGYFDEDGYLYVIGRIKNMIKTGGYSVFPEEVEMVLQSNNAVKEAFVYGVDDNVLGGKIVADIVPITDIEHVEQIKNYCMENIANYKVPDEIRIVNSISKTLNGKIKRRVDVKDV